MKIKSEFAKSLKSLIEPHLVKPLWIEIIPKAFNTHDSRVGLFIKILNKSLVSIILDSRIDIFKVTKVKDHDFRYTYIALANFEYYDLDIDKMVELVCEKSKELYQNKKLVKIMLKDFKK